MGQYAGSDIVLESNSLLRAFFSYQKTKKGRLNMEKCAEFLARMIQKYGDVVLGEIGDSDIFYVRQPYDDGQPK